MIVYFGLDFDDVVYPKYGELSQSSTLGHHYNGPKGILYLLETHLGLAGYPNDIDHLRIEKFRQALTKYLAIKPDAFFKNSFHADQLATANTLLERRDELLLAGWNFKTDDTTPIRLKTLAQLHSMAKEEEMLPGYAERFMDVLHALTTKDSPIDEVWLNEPFHLLPPHLQRLFDRLKSKNIPFKTFEKPTYQTTNDLAKFRTYLSNPKAHTGKLLDKDGSLLILKSKRETDAATYLAKFFKSNTDFNPVCLIPEKNRALDNAFIQEGLPSLGILSDSLARPMLQMLKLVSAFIWKPIDPFKILEFVTLPLKPLSNEQIPIYRKDDAQEDGEKKIIAFKSLSDIIAEFIAKKPGLRGQELQRAVNGFFVDLEEEAKLRKTKGGEQLNVGEIRKEYRFWFDRQQYDTQDTAPVADFIEIYRYIQKWAKATFDSKKDKEKINFSSLLVLSEQARRIADMLETLPNAESELTYLQAERIVRTIYQSSPVMFRTREVGALPYVHHPSTLVGKTDHLVWWNFIHQNPPFYFNKWYKKELTYLENKGAKLQLPYEESQVELWQRLQPFYYTQHHAILIMPEKVNGEDVSPHPLFGDLQAAFANIEEVVIDIDSRKNIDILTEKLKLNLPQKELLDGRLLHQPKSYIKIDRPILIQADQKESYSSLESLFYYPYKWFFKYQLKLRKSALMSIVKEHTLLGNLAHSLFELLLKEEEVLTWSAPKIHKWIDKQVFLLLEREGATLLLYGKEPDRAAFINKIKFSATNLLRLIKINGWTIRKVEKEEQDKEEMLGPIKVIGRIDLELSKANGERAVVDLKWRGATRRKDLIRNKEDLQLVMYAQLLKKETDTLPHTAFYIIENGQMIARNTLAFKEAIEILPQEDYQAVHDEIWKKMQATYAWRIEQLQSGQIEVRTEETVDELEDDMEYELLKDILAMKSKNAPYDDYTTLISMLF